MHSQGRRHECYFRVRTPSKAGASTRLTQIRIVANTPLMRFQHVGVDLRKLTFQSGPDYGIDIVIGADFLGALGANAPREKLQWVRRTQKNLDHKLNFSGRM